MGPVRAAVASLLLAGALVAAGCNRGDDPTVGPGAGGSTIPGSSLGTSATTAPPPPAVVGMRPPITAPGPGERGFLTDVRIGARTTGDRIVFEFDPVVPAYSIDFTTRPVTQDGSGKPVDVAGEALLAVRFEDSATARFEGERVIPTFDGPRRLKGEDTAVVTEAVLIGDFEGIVSWVVGLRARPETLSVSVLSGPSRLVVDVPSA